MRAAGQQTAVVVGILAYTAVLGGSVYGVRAALGRGYVWPECQALCGAAGARPAEVDYRVGKSDHHSLCVCDSGARLESARATRVAELSVLAPLGLTLLATALLVGVLARRGARPANDEAPDHSGPDASG